MTHTSAHAASAVHYSFFMLRGPGRYTSDRHAGIRKVAKRCAKKRERAAFMREQHHLMLADNLSKLIEKEIEYDDYYDRMDAQENMNNVKTRMRQRFLQRLGEGALFWDYAATDTWQLNRVWFDDYDQHSDYWSTYCVAAITIDRRALHWVINFSSDSAPQIELPYMEHSLEGVQQYTRLIYTLDKEDTR